ncbi:MAG: hypothetical protein ACTSO7_06535 [Candidatus Heimdallarchaeota archaeon]
MAETQLTKKIIILTDRLVTPIIVSSPTFWKHGCLVKVVGNSKTESKAQFTSIGKLVKGERKAPIILRGYNGFVKVSCIGSSENQLLSKMEQFLQMQFLGTKTSEGYGRVNWGSCELKDFTSTNSTLVLIADSCPQCKNKTVTYDYRTKNKRCTSCNQTWRRKQFKIRKGIGTNYPKELQRLLIALMLHDFVDTELHPSKIYRQLKIEDEVVREACLNHHNSKKIPNKLHQLVKSYDGVASKISRKKHYSVHNRYSKEKGQIDFELLARDIEQNQHSAQKLYNYIYNSDELERLVESLRFGHNTLRNHLLLMVNLTVNDYYDKKLTITKGKISLSASGRDELKTAMDAEMHSFTDHDTVNSERATTS